MPVPLVAISAGLGIASKLFGGKKRPNISRAIAELRAARPTGYLTPADTRAAELTRGRLTEGVQAQGQLGQYEIQRRSRARGLAGSPSEERSLARLQQQTLLGTQHAGEASEEQLYNVGQSREAFERQKALDIFGAQVGDQQRESARQDAQNGAFWNSINEMVPSILGTMGQQGTDFSGYVLGPDGKYGPPQYGPPSSAMGGPAGPTYNPTQPNRGFQPEARPF